MNNVLILREPDKAAQQQAKKRGWETAIEPGSVATLPFDRALIVAPGGGIPWDLVAPGMSYLERWDVAAPLWRYNVLAADVGTPAERKRTEKVVRDLRVLLYAHELLFVRDSPDGRALLAAFEQEQYPGGEPRLAFLRALFLVKPLFCALPTTWLAPSQAGVQVAVPSGQAMPSPTRRSRARRRGNVNLVRVEIRPGVFATCRPGEEEMVKARLQRMHQDRQNRRGG